MRSVGLSCMQRGGAALGGAGGRGQGQPAWLAWRVEGGEAGASLP